MHGIDLSSGCALLACENRRSDEPFHDDQREGVDIRPRARLSDLAVDLLGSRILWQEHPQTGHLRARFARRLGEAKVEQFDATTVAYLDDK